MLGDIGLAEAVQPVGVSPTDEAVVPLAGGPGQAALPFAADFAESLKPLLASRDLLVFDQRGTGSSGAIGCFGDAGPSSGSQVSACASMLGGAHAFYRSIDSADDIEALRVAGGYRKLVLYGVSYGTRVALTYAARYPDRVAGAGARLGRPARGAGRLVAAVVRRARARAARPVRRRRMPPARPRAPTRTCGRWSSTWAARPLSGSITGPDGDRITIRLTEVGLWQTLLAGDLNPTLRAELPGAVRAALRGDRTPLLRLRARAAGLTGTVPTAAPAGLQSAGDDVNTGLFTATRCSETNFPWTASASSSARMQQATTALRGVGTSRFAPFDLSVPLAQSVVELCASWPDAPLPPTALGALPAVPTLVLEGDGRPAHAARAGPPRRRRDPRRPDLRRRRHRALRPGQRPLGLRRRRARGVRGEHDQHLQADRLADQPDAAAAAAPVGASPAGRRRCARSPRCARRSTTCAAS